MTGERAGELLERHPRVGDDRQAALLGGVERRNVDVDEADVRILERRLRRGREVAPPRADADHEVGVAGQPVGGRRPGRADGAEAQRMVGDERAAAGLGLAHGNAGGVDELAQGAERRRCR